MAFKGYYLKFDNVQLDNKYCCNYKTTPDRRTDKNSFIDANGKLQRTVLPHKRSGCTFNTGFITDNDIPNLANIFNGRDNVLVEMWNPSAQSYKTVPCYVPDMEFEALIELNGVNYYRPVELEIIEY